MKQIFDIPKFVQTASKGLDNGAVMRSVTTLAWDLAGKCEAPVYREMTARARPAGMEVFQEIARAVTGRRDIEFDTRCRKCPPCLRARAAFWRMRAEGELRQCPGRTWFGTLTLSPESHFQMLLRASRRLADRGEAFDRLDADRQFAERHREVSREITLWLKRVRKESGVPLRYCLVAEAHKSGLPHYHVLMHEAAAERPLRASVVRDQWKLGFTKFNLVAEDGNAKSAAYVTKYLAKSAIARVRASQGYGQNSQIWTPLGIEQSIVREVFRREKKEKPPLTPQFTPPNGVSVDMGTVQ